MALSRSRYYYSSPSEDTIYHHDRHYRPSRQFGRSEYLGDIIDVDPFSPCFTCVGWAPSRGRRCRNGIAQHNKAHASRLLAEGTIRLQRREDVSDILEELAPRVLCRKTPTHQRQASNMVELWEDMISEHLEDQAASARAARRLRRLRRALEHSQERDLQLPVRREEPSQPPTAGFGSSPSPFPVHVLVEASRTPRSVPVPQPATSSFHSAQQASSRIDRRPPGGSTARAEPVIESIFGSSRSGSTTDAVRKRIRPNDDCPICQEPFILNSTSSSSRRSQSLNGHDVITWCRARCGVNFHRSCINEWKSISVRASQVTCPCCRTTWRDGDDSAAPELEDSEEVETETETTNADRYHHVDHSGSQRLNRGGLHEAADEADMERGEEIEGNFDEEAEEDEDDDEDEEDEEDEEAEEVEEEEEVQEQEQRDDGDVALGREPVTTTEMDGEVTVGQDETESNHDNDDSVEADVAPTATAVLNRQETETSKSGCPTNPLPAQWRREDPHLSGYLDATSLLFSWVLGL